MAELRTKLRSSSIGGAAKKRVMVLDDHPLVRKGLENLLATTGDLEVVAESGNTIEARTALENQVPDLLVLDLSLPGIGGLEFIKSVRNDYPNLPILVLSIHEESVYAERTLRSGARGYIMKHETGEKVIEAIRCILDGGIYVSQNLMSRILSLLSSAGRVPTVHIGPETMGDRELQVYTLIGQGYSTKEIAEKLNLSTKTVQTHREHIKAKLGLKSASELSHSAALWNMSGK